MLKRKKLIAFLVTGALAIAGVFGVFSYQQVFAQAPTPTQAPGTTTNNNQAVPGKGFGGPRGGGVVNSDLATALGITTDQLTTAITTANTAALKEAVSKGLITQAQADQITANGLNRPLDDLGRFAGANASTIDYNALLAQALGITTDKLTAAYAQANNARIDAAVAAGNLTQAQADEMKGSYALQNNANFLSAIKSAYQAAVKQAVTEGVITQAQADAILARQAQGQGRGFGLGGFGPGFEGRGGGHGHGGFGGPGFGGQNGQQNGQPNNNNSTTPAPTTSGNGI